VFDGLYPSVFEFFVDTGFFLFLFELVVIGIEYVVISLIWELFSFKYSWWLGFSVVVANIVSFVFGLVIFFAFGGVL